MKTLRLGAIAALIAGPAAALEIQDLTSPDGHAFWLVEEDAVPIVSVEIGFNTGSRLDPDDKTGLSNFTFALMDEGAGDMDMRWPFPSAVTISRPGSGLPRGSIRFRQAVSFWRKVWTKAST